MKIKMKRFRVLVLTLLFVVFGVSGASAVTVVDLFDWGFNIDGTTYLSPVKYSPPGSGQLPVSINVSGFTFSNGIGSGGGVGTITIDVAGAGAHSVIGFFDHEIDEADNTYFNEYGAAGSPDAGQSWEIDEPGDVFGNIYEHVLAGSLDNTNSVPSTVPDDVSMAMGWNFTLAAGESGQIRLVLTDTAPDSGFYLSQTDPDSKKSIYFRSSLGVQGGGNVIPEPGTMLLLGSGVVGLFGLGRKRFKKS